MNTPAIRVIGPSGSGRSSIAAALHKLLASNGVCSELINCAVDASTWRMELKSLMSGRLLPIIVSPTREGEGVPPTVDLLQDLATARRAAQDMHTKCQNMEAELARAEVRLANACRGDYSGYVAAARRQASYTHEANLHTVREQAKQRYDRMLADYKDATRTEMKALRQGSCPGLYMVSHTDADGKITPNVVMCYHKPSIEEVRDVAGYPEVGEIAIGPILAPLIPPRAKN